MNRDHPWKRVVDGAVAKLLARREQMKEFVLMTGRPPLSVLLTPTEQFEEFMDPIIRSQKISAGIAKDPEGTAKWVDKMVKKATTE